MLKGAVAHCYARAFFDLALKNTTVDATLQDIREIAQVFANRKISYLLREPKIPIRRKEEALRAALKGRVKDMSLNLALLLVQRELVEYMSAIAQAFEQLVLDYRNQAVADVTTATEVNPAERVMIQRALEQRTGKTIIMQSHVDPAILGGVIARVGDSIIDGSVRYRLSVLEQRLLNDVSSSSAQFLTPEELAQTKQAVSSVARNSSAIKQAVQAAQATQTTENTQIDGYNDVPAPTGENRGTSETEGQDDQSRYNTVPDTNSSAYRS